MTMFDFILQISFSCDEIPFKRYLLRLVLYLSPTRRNSFITNSTPQCIQSPIPLYCPPWSKVSLSSHSCFRKPTSRTRVSVLFFRLSWLSVSYSTSAYPNLSCHLHPQKTCCNSWRQETGLSLSFSDTSKFVLSLYYLKDKTFLKGPTLHPVRIFF